MKTRKYCDWNIVTPQTSKIRKTCLKKTWLKRSKVLWYSCRNTFWILSKTQLPCFLKIMHDQLYFRFLNKVRYDIRDIGPKNPLAMTMRVFGFLHLLIFKWLFWFLSFWSSAILSILHFKKIHFAKIWKSWGLFFLSFRNEKSSRLELKIKQPTDIMRFFTDSICRDKFLAWLWRIRW